MIRLKSPKEIEILAEGGKILAKILHELAQTLQAGMTSQELDRLAQKHMKQHGVQSSFLGYRAQGHKSYPAVTCVSINEGVVHGIPGPRVFQEGDIVGIDCGIIHQGMYLDSAHTSVVGKVSAEIESLLRVTREALEAGIAAAQAGNRIGDIGAAVQAHAERAGFGIVRQLVGHGVGYGVHEEPQVPNFGKAGTGIELKEGLVIAIEPMFTTGKAEVTTGPDGWTIITADGSMSAHEEHTIAVTAEGPKILTELA